MKICKLNYQNGKSFKWFLSYRLQYKFKVFICHNQTFWRILLFCLLNNLLCEAIWIFLNLFVVMIKYYNMIYNYRICINIHKYMIWIIFSYFFSTHFICHYNGFHFNNARSLGIVHKFLYLCKLTKST